MYFTGHVFVATCAILLCALSTTRADPDDPSAEFEEAEYIARIKCLDDFEPCSYNQQCCSNFCTRNQYDKTFRCKTPGVKDCKNDNEKCSYNDECCSHKCIKYYSSDGTEYGLCGGGGGPPVHDCILNDEPCSQDEQCCSWNCEIGIFSGVRKATCRPRGAGSPRY